MAPNAANASAVPMLVQSADRLKMLLEGVQVPASGPPTGALTHRRVPTYRGRVSRSTVGWADTFAMQCGVGGAHRCCWRACSGHAAWSMHHTASTIHHAQTHEGACSILSSAIQHAMQQATYHFKLSSAPLEAYPDRSVLRPLRRYTRAVRPAAHTRNTHTPSCRC